MNDTTDQFVTLYRGDDMTQAFQLYRNDDPLDLTAATVISACFPNEDNTELTLGLGTGIAVVSGILGKLSVTITAAQSALLAPRDRMSIDFVVTIAGKVQTYTVPRALTILDRSC